MIRLYNLCGSLSLSLSLCVYMYVISTYILNLRAHIIIGNDSRVCDYLNEISPWLFVVPSIIFSHFPTWIGYHESPLVFAMYWGLESPIAWNICDFIVNYHPLWLAGPWLNPLRGLRRHFFSTGTTFSSISILSIIVFSCKAPCQASFCPLPPGLKFYQDPRII